MTDRWKRDRTGEIVADDSGDRPREPHATLVKGRAPVFEVTASWIGDDGRVRGVTREAPDREQLRAAIGEIEAAHGRREAFTFDVDVIDGRGFRRSLSTHERDAATAREAIAGIRDALKNRPLDPPVDLTEPF